MVTSIFSVKLLFSVFQVTWIVILARKHLQIRSQRSYAKGRTLTASNNRYKILSFGLLLQNILCVWFFWSDDPYLWKFHNSDFVRSIGVALKIGATTLYFVALRHLGTQYSPCYDAHAPSKMVRSGPYAFARHPMYVAKISIGISEVLLSGSYWYIPGAVYLTYETVKAWKEENRLLYP